MTVRAWTDAQKDFVDNNPKMHPRDLAVELSKIGPPRTAGGVMKYIQNYTGGERPEKKAQPAIGWPIPLGDGELIRRIAEHQIQRRAA